MTFKEAINKYMKYVKVTKSKGTYDFHIGNAKRLTAFFGEMNCEDIKRDQILDLILYLKDKNNKISIATINKYIGLLLRTLRNECNIDIKFDKLKEQKKMISIVSHESIQKIFQHYEKMLYPEHLRNLVFFRILLDTGLRLSEILSLKVSNINFNDQSILARKTKTKEDRLVFYTKPTEVFLNKYIINEKITDHLFIDLNTRKILKIDRIQKICQNLRKTLHIRESVTPHKWRHTFATQFNNQNGNLEVLRILMGHSNILTTQRYLHINTQKLRHEYFRVFE